ncbi:MAG: hypothetical protein K2H76_09950, partial [Muribaculaceae bacterium]|nr:hypothetical protein [Muribaculaceae bacterium]
MHPNEGEIFHNYAGYQQTNYYYMESMKTIPFTKMHGVGNDYVYIDALTEVPDNLPLLSKQISDRHFGVGSDGL